MNCVPLPPKVFFFCVVGIASTHWLAPMKLPDVLFWPGLALLGFGISLASAGSSHFERVGTNIKTFDDPGKLVDDGLFCYTRNPMYVGLLAALIGLALACGNWVGFIFPLLFFAMLQFVYIPFEERRMLEIFGERYLEYKSRVRRWI